MKNKKLVVGIMLAVLIIICVVLCIVAYNKRQKINEANRLKVVTSFYPIYVATLNITEGVPGVVVENLSEPQTGCLHDYQLTSDDVKLLSTADVFLVNGGGMESFLDLDEFAKKYPDLTVVSIDENLPKEKLDKDNSHYWMNLDFYEIYVQKIAIALADKDTEHSLEYMENYRKYADEVDNLIEKANQVKAASNSQGVILLHEAFGYLADELGLDTKMVLDLDDGAEISPSDLSKACKLIEDGEVVYILGESTYGSAIAKTIEDETGLPTIFIDPLITGEYKKDTYLDGMRDNLNELEKGLRLR